MKVSGQLWGSVAVVRLSAAVIGKLLPVPRIIGNDMDEERGGREKPGSAKGLFIGGGASLFPLCSRDLLRMSTSLYSACQWKRNVYFPVIVAQTAFQAFGLVYRKMSARQGFGGKENRSPERWAVFHRRCIWREQRWKSYAPEVIFSLGISG